jgi:hypothetical protein
MNVHVALLHYPVYNRQRQIIVSAVTNLDIHDISRAALTYGVRRFYVVTPLDDQQHLVERLLTHWRDGYGARSNPERKLALDLVTLSASLAEVIDRIIKSHDQRPELLVTGASVAGPTLSYSQARARICQGMPVLLLFGTGWGLSGEVMDMADYRLPPVYGQTDYNHLSVRSAVAIILDRLLGGIETTA